MKGERKGWQGTISPTLTIHTPRPRRRSPHLLPPLGPSPLMASTTCSLLPAPLATSSLALGWHQVSSSGLGAPPPAPWTPTSPNRTQPTQGRGRSGVVRVWRS